MTARSAGAGDLSEYIEILKPLDTDDSTGGYDRQFEHFSNVWAQVTPVRGDETDRQGALRNVNRAIFTVYRDLSILESMVIRWLGEDFNIKEIRRPAARQLYMDIVADQGVTL